MGLRLKAVLALAATFSLTSQIAAIGAEEPKLPPCTEDAMLVFDASGSMSGNVGLGVATTITRIDQARAALAKVLPSATKFRRVGLITYGPGPYNTCNVHLDLEPMPDAANAIMRAVNALTPAGKTPLTASVNKAADVLHFREKPGVIVDRKGLKAETNTAELEQWCRDAIVANPKALADFKSGKESAMNAFKGPVMKAAKGKANPKLVDETLRRLLATS